MSPSGGTGQAAANYIRASAPGNVEARGSAICAVYSPPPWKNSRTLYFHVHPHSHICVFSAQISAGDSTTAFAEVAGPDDGGHIAASFPAPDNVPGITAGLIKASSTGLSALLTDRNTLVGAYAVALKRRDPEECISCSPRMACTRRTRARRWMYTLSPPLTWPASPTTP